MANAPTITISGNLVRDPELRFTPNGTPVCKFTVACTPRERDAGGEWKDGEPQYWDVTAWRQLGENVAESLVRGDPVIVTGSVRFRTWSPKPTDRNPTPENRLAHEITADHIGVSLAFHTIRVRRATRKPNGDATGETADTDNGTSVFAGK